jgi:hypothetical protein
MVNFLQKFDLEADLYYEGMIPGTVTLDGYMEGCNRFKGNIIAQPKPPTANRSSQKCRTCLELCLDGLVNKMVRAGLKEVENSVEEGCPSFKVLQDGIALCEPDFPPDTPTGEIPKMMDSYSMTQREGYFMGHGRDDFEDDKRVINAVNGRGCGLCIAYIYRNGPGDRLRTVIELDFFLTKVMSRNFDIHNALY